jgi:hypothetical protein
MFVNKEVGMFIRMISRWSLWRLENKYGVTPRDRRDFSGRLNRIRYAIDERYLDLCGNIKEFIDGLEMEVTTDTQVRIFGALEQLANQTATARSARALWDLVSELADEALRENLLEEHAGLDCRACELYTDLEKILTLRRHLDPNSSQHRSALRPAP